MFKFSVKKNRKIYVDVSLPVCSQTEVGLTMLKTRLGARRRSWNRVHKVHFCHLFIAKHLPGISREFYMHDLISRRSFVGPMSGMNW